MRLAVLVRIEIVNSHLVPFPFDDIELIPRPHRNLLRHGWMKFVERRPPLIYRGEYQMLVSILALRGADNVQRDSRIACESGRAAGSPPAFAAHHGRKFSGQIP